MTFADLSPLANHLWQSTCCAAVAWLLTLALRKNRAPIRYWIWLAASVKFLIPFAWLAALGSSLDWRAAPAAAPLRIPILAAQIGQPFEVAAPAALPLASAPAHLWPAVLLVVWLCGIAIGLAFWIRSARRMSAILRAAKPLDLHLPIPVLSTPGPMEPGVFGIWKPALLLPEGIAERLTPAQLQAVLAHELRHVHRRDNLTAAIHMLVETTFWFHPLVWWIRTRLIEERERACDEGVLLLGSAPQVYVESILKVCEFYLSAPACTAGVTGGELKRRIEGIMANRFARELNLGRKLLLAAVAVVALTGPILIGLTNPPRSRAQEQTAAPLSFDVASVKAVSQEWIETSPKRSPGRFTWTTDLLYLIQYAYRMQPFRISGPIPSDNLIAYRVEATMNPAATEDQVRLMLRSLLADRFKMTSHFVTRAAGGYNLSVAKNGPKIHEAEEGEPPPPLPERFQNADPAALEGRVVAIGMGSGDVALTGRKVSMLQFCEALQRHLNTAVWDETGLKGNYYFEFRYAPENAPIEAEAPPLNAALQQALGLKIEKRKGPVQMLVVDHIEKTPTEN